MWDCCQVAWCEGVCDAINLCQWAPRSHVGWGGLCCAPFLAVTPCVPLPLPLPLSLCGLCVHWQTSAAAPTPSGYFALVVGNNAYAGSPLSKCERDAGDMADLLLRAGFTVTKLLNASKRQ
jgi:hypothetical protein